MIASAAIAIGLLLALPDGRLDPPMLAILNDAADELSAASARAGEAITARAVTKAARQRADVT